MKPPLKPLTVAHCDLMETGVQASSGWMVRRRLLSHSGPQAAPEAARWSLPWLRSIQTVAVPADSGRTVQIFLQGHILNLGGKREKEIETEKQREIFVKTWPEMRRKRSPCWVGLCKPRNTESGRGRASSPWTSWFVRRGTGKWGSWSLEARIMPQLALKLPTVKERS
jgi:hypothetical protein